MKNILSTIIVLSLFTNIIFSQENPNTNIDMLLLKGKYQEVINLLEPIAFSSDSLEAKDFYSLGIAYQQFYKNAKAERMFSMASKLESNNSTYLFAFAKALLTTNNTNYAYSVFKETLEKDPENLSAKIEIAKLSLDLGKYNDAKKLFTELISVDSTNAYFFQKLGYTELKLGNKNDAIINYKKSLKLRQFNPTTNMQLASIYFKEKEYEETYKILTNCLANNSRHLPLNRLMGEVVFQLKKYKASVVQYEHLINIGDSTDVNYQKLGFSYYFISQSKFTTDTLIIKNLNLAITVLLKAKSINESDPLTHLYLGICFKELKKYDLAITSLAESLNYLFPEYTSDVFSHLAVSYELNKDFSLAIKNYLQAYEYNPANKVLLFSIASTMDQYYLDRKIPILYYNLFLKNYSGEDENLTDYAIQRIEKLKEENHFSAKHSKK